MGKTQVRFVFLAAIAAVVFVFAANPFSGGGGQPPPAALAAPGPGDTVYAGYDLFETDSSDTFLDFPVPGTPADFFGPGSDPFDGRVYYEGDPIPTYEPSGGPVYTELGPTSMIVWRYDDAGPTFPDTVGTQIVALNLKSVDPITVTYGEDPSKQWDITAVVPENDVNQTPGSMSIDHEYATGGTFGSSLPVDPLLTFTEVGGPGTAGPVYYSSLFGSGLDFNSLAGQPWNHTANPLMLPGGHWVIEKEGLTSNFFPGIDGTSGERYKGLFQLNDPVTPTAQLTVQPAELPMGTTVGDCSERPSELDTGTDVFDSTAAAWMYLDGIGGMSVDLEGDTTVERRWDPDPVQEGVIDLEMVELSLVSTSPTGVTLTAGSGLGEPPSLGEVASTSGDDDFPADSFFDLYIEIDATGAGYGIYHNHDPVHMVATLSPDPEGVVCLPPYDISYVATNLPVELYDAGDTNVGRLYTSVTHTLEPPRSITTIKLDGVTEEPLAGAVFTLHEGYGCDPPAVDATTTDGTGVGDLGPMGGGLYSVQEVIPPEGSDLPDETCTDVDHTVPYNLVEVIDGGPDLVGGVDYFPSNAKAIFDIPALPDLDYVVLNGQTVVDRGALITGPPDYISTTLISMVLTGNHPVLGPVKVTAGAGLGYSGLPPSIGQIQNVENDGVNLTYGDSFFDLYVEIEAGGYILVNTESPIHISSPISQLPPELNFFDNGFTYVPLETYPGATPVGGLTYTLYVPLPRGELDVIIQDPLGPLEHISYSIEFNSASNYAGFFHAADILVPSVPTVVRSCASLGLSGNGCAFASPQDDMNSLSYGFDFSSANTAEPAKVFSVDAASLGLPGTHVDIEHSCSGGPEAHADLFRTPLDGSNQQEFDGDGYAGAPGCLASYPLGLIEPSAPPAGDNLNALGELPTGDPVYFTLAPSSPSLLDSGSGGLGLCDPSACTTAHIFKSTAGVVSIYATPTDLGLVAGDIIDALALRESDGLFDVNPADGVFDSPPDLLHFSLDPGSPSLTDNVDSAADQFAPKTTPGGLPVLVVGANAHGLEKAMDVPPHGDNLDAIKVPYLDGDGDLVPDPIDPDPSIPTGYFDDGTIWGSIAANVTLTDLPNSVQAEAPMGGGGGGVFASCPLTPDSDGEDITLSLDEGEIATLGCESSASVTIVNGPANVAFGPFNATVPTGSKVIIRQLPTPGPGVCPGDVPPGAYQITHSVGTLNVTIWSGSMSTVTLPPGSVYRDCDADGIFGVVDLCSADSDNDSDGDTICVGNAAWPPMTGINDNCPVTPNPGQENTDADLAGAGASVTGDPMGDACDDEDDNDSESETQDPGTAATTCPSGTLPVWADCVETYLGTVLGDNCTGAPGPGGDAWPPDINVDSATNILDVFQMLPYWLNPSPTGREDLNADAVVNILDVFKLLPFWLDTCS